MDPSRDVMILENTPMDYLDFASPQPGLAGKIGIDATTKIGSETAREWGRVMRGVAEDQAFAADLVTEVDEFAHGARVVRRLRGPRAFDGVLLEEA